LVGLGLSEDALRMFAATEAERSHQGVKITDPVMVKSLERRLRPARSTLTAERQEQVEAEGYEMSLEQAVKYALAIRSPRK